MDIPAEIPTFVIETRLGARTFAQLTTRVANLENKLAAYIEAGAEARHTRPIELALADALRDMDNAL